MKSKHTEESAQIKLEKLKKATPIILERALNKKTKKK